MFNILVVEDSFSNTLLLCEGLSVYGLNSTSAKNGEEALKMCEKEKFDLILLDLMMPKMNGYEFLFNVNYGKKIDNTPIIIISTFIKDDEFETLYENGIKHIFKKPYDFDLLLETINNILNENKQ